MLIDKETYEGWTEAAKKTDRNGYIYPRATDPEVYELSGKKDAAYVMQYLKPSDYVMDYGCGTGRVLKHIPNQKVGIDAVKEMARSVDGFLPEEFTDKVDVIYSLSVFIHNSKAAGEQMIKWMSEHINKGGTLLLQIPIYDVDKEPGGWIDVGVWTEKQLRAVAEKYGLTIIELNTNPGEFSFEKVGENHGKFQILTK